MLNAVAGIVDTKVDNAEFTGIAFHNSYLGGPAGLQHGDIAAPAIGTNRCRGNAVIDQAEGRFWLPDASARCPQ